MIQIYIFCCVEFFEVVIEGDAHPSFRDGRYVTYLSGQTVSQKDVEIEEVREISPVSVHPADPRW